MKNVLVLLFICIQCNLYSQELNTYSVKKIHTQEKTFKGRIDGKYDIIMYLKYYKTSDINKDVYSVKGYYYYDAIQTHIPIEGLYILGDLVLYVFDDKEKSNVVLDPTSNDHYYLWEQIDYLKNIEGYKEKFIIKPSDGQMEWLKDERTVNLEFYQNDFSIVTETEYLQINNSKQEYHISFKDIGFYEENLSVINFKKIKNETRVLLKFDSPSNLNYNQRCGVGREVGYVILTFDMQGQIVHINSVLIDSCWEGIYVDTPVKISTEDPTIKIFHIESFDKEPVDLKLDVENIEWID